VSTDENRQSAQATRSFCFPAAPPAAPSTESCSKCWTPTPAGLIAPAKSLRIACVTMQHPGLCLLKLIPPVTTKVRARNPKHSLARSSTDHACGQEEIPCTSSFRIHALWSLRAAEHSERSATTLIPMLSFYASSTIHKRRLTNNFW
jgi:hypothetical protein